MNILKDRFSCENQVECLTPYFAVGKKDYYEELE